MAPADELAWVPGCEEKEVTLRRPAKSRERLRVRSRTSIAPAVAGSSEGAAATSRTAPPASLPASVSLRVLATRLFSSPSSATQHWTLPDAIARKPHLRRIKNTSSTRDEVSDPGEDCERGEG